MTDETTHTSTPISRRHALGMVGAGIAALTAPSAVHADGLTFPFFPQVTSGPYTPESIPEIVGNMLTQEYLHGSVSAALLLTPSLAATMGLTSGLPLAHFQSLAAIHQDRIEFWTSLVPEANAKAITSFTVDPALLSGPKALFPAGESVDSLRIATAITAAREFAELGQPTLAKYAAQTIGSDGGVWAGLRFLEVLDGSTSAVPPVNKAFSTDLVLYTRDAVAILRALGIIGGTGTPVAYPGRDAMLKAAGPMAAAVLQARPNNATSTVQVSGLSSLTAARP